MKLSYLLQDTISNITDDRYVDNIICDLKICKENDLLFLLNKNSEKEFSSSSKNVSIVVAGESYIDNNPNYTLYTVSNPRKTLAFAMYRMYCHHLNGTKFIGITGTNGKSTTALLIKSILSDFGYNVGLIGTANIMFNDKILSENNYSMTTPPPEILFPAIKQLIDLGADIIVMEVSSHALDQDRVSPINFDIGIFTNLSPEHLDYHKNVDNYFLAKTKLISQCKRVLVNSDDFYGRLTAMKFNNTESCGISRSSNTKIYDIKNNVFYGSTFLYESINHSEKFDLSLVGANNIYNAMMAIRCAEILEVPIKNIKNSIKKIKSINGRFEIINERPMIVIDYAHTSQAFENILFFLNSSKNAEQKIIVVFGCGGERDKNKRYTMGKIADKYADAIILTSDNPRGEDPLNIIEEIAAGITRAPYKIIDRQEAIRTAIKKASKNDIVAIIGKGPERYTIINKTYFPFNEREIVLDALSEFNV